MSNQIQVSESGVFPSNTSGLPDPAWLAQKIKENYQTWVNEMDVKEISKRKYMRWIKPFIEWVDVVDINTVRRYKGYVETLELSAASKRAYVTIVKKLFKELHTHYRLLPFDIGASVKAPKVSNGHTTDGLTHSEVQRIAAYIDSQDASKRLRLNAIFHLYALQALRSKEVVLLCIENINLAAGVARVDGKTGADQTIFLLPQTVQALRAYIEDAGIKSGYLFRNRSNSAKGNVPISPRSVRRIFTKVFNELGIERSVHGFRHYCITRLIELDFAFDEVMRYARIKDMNTIKKYNDRVNAKREAARIAEKLTL